MFNTLPANPYPPSSEQMGAGGGSYVLPTASASTLGGVKVGSNLSIADGVLSAPAPYTPPDYSTTEHDTGIKWVDGKTIYRIVVNVGELPDNSTKTITLGLSVDSLVRLNGCVTAGNNGFLPLPFVSFDGSSAYCTWLSIDDSGDLIVTDNAPFGTAGYTGVCIIEYTKTESEV